MATIGDFWRFTLETYEKPGVSPQLIQLQDEAGRDVNILLCCLYAGLRLGLSLGPGELEALAAAVEPWNSLVTQKLRAVRRDLKPLAADPAVAELRRAVQATELEAERLAQARLEAALPAGPIEKASAELARANLIAYAGEAGAKLVDLL